MAIGMKVPDIRVLSLLHFYTVSSQWRDDGEGR